MALALEPTVFPFRGVTICGGIAALIFNDRRGPRAVDVQSVTVLVASAECPIAVRLLDPPDSLAAYQSACAEIALACWLRRAEAGRAA